MVRTIKGKMIRYGSKVLIHIPMELVRDSTFPFLIETLNEDIIIEIKGRSLSIRKRKEA